MSRDISGNYTLPAGNPVVNGTTIETDWANTTLADIAVQLNNVFTRDGVLGPLSAFKLVDGTSALPGGTFTNQLGTGIWNAATTAGYSFRGAAHFTSSANLLTVNVPLAGSNVSLSGTLDVTGATTLGGALGVTGLVSLASTLSVAAAATFASSVSVAGSLTSAGNVLVQNTAPSVSVRDTTVGNVQQFDFTVGGTYFSFGSGGIVDNTAGRKRYEIASTGKHAWYTGADVERIQLSAAGLVGIGGTPTSGEGALQVVGAAKVTTGLNVTGSGGFFNGANKFGVDVNSSVVRMYASGPDSSTRGGFEFHTTDSAGGLDTVAASLAASGSLLVGTTTDAAKVSVGGSIRSLGGDIVVDTGMLTTNSTSNTLKLGVNSSVAVTIDYLGNIGVARAPTGDKLAVNGTVAATAFSGPLTGAVTGNVTGNLTGDVTGNVVGNVTGNLTGNADTATTVGESPAFSGTVNLSSGAGSLNVAGHKTRFESAEQTPGIVTATFTFAHGGSRVPDLALVYLRCKTAEHGWAVGDEIVFRNDIANTSRESQIVVNTTNILFLYRTTGGSPAIRNSSGTMVGITVANWAWVAKAHWL